MLKRKLKIAMIATGLIVGACNNSKKTDMDTHQNHQNHATYTCPMHPEVTGNQGDKCPECGMDLVATVDKSSTFTVDVFTTPNPVVAGKAANMKFVFKNGENPVEMEVAHVKKLHLMAVSDDLAWFRHIHPTEQSDGSYVISEAFPYGGKYFLYADYKPLAGAPTLNRKEITVAGESRSTNVFNATKNVSVVDGYKVTIENASDLKTNRSQPLQISVEKAGKKLTEQDIEQYLGANAHIVMISRADREYLHIHPMSNAKYPIYAETNIEKSGLYRIWVEFQVEGKVRTADFTVDVSAGGKQSQDHHGHNH